MEYDDVQPANVNDQPIRAGVVGCPIGHSLSPVIHRYWLDKYGINGTYDAVEVAPDELEAFLGGLHEAGFAGINLTLPHKEAAMAMVQRLDNVEQVIGAINTIWVDPETGELDGNNTDYYGFYKNLQQFAPDFDYKAGPAVILGAGGACNAVATALLVLCGVSELVIVNRTLLRAQEKRDHLLKMLAPIADRIVIRAEAWGERDALLAGANLVVNTTSLGMTGQPPLEIDLAALPTSALVTDIVYNPLETELLKAAKARGNMTVDGIGMLLHQAVLGFHKWFGVEPEVDDALREHVLAQLAG